MVGDFRFEIFVMAAQTLSFTRTAEAIGISQPAVTKHIKELELRIGGALFMRNGGHISLTERGFKLLPMANALLAEYQKINNAFASDDTSFRGSLRLGASTTLAQYILPRILACFKRDYPEITLTLKSGNSEEISDGVAKARLDFALVEGDDTHPSLHYDRFAEDSIVLVTAQNNDKVKDDIISLNKLRLLPLVVRESGSGTLSVIDHALMDVGIPRRGLNVVMALGSSESIVRYLLNSDACAFLSLAAAADHIKEHRLRIIQIEGLTINRTLRFVQLHGNNARAAELFKAYCLRHYNH